MVLTLLLNAWMQEVYKEHLVRADARGSSGGFHPVVEVSWSEESVAKVRLWMDDAHTFRTQIEAQLEGITIGKKWIDAGKPGNGSESHH